MILELKFQMVRFCAILVINFSNSVEDTNAHLERIIQGRKGGNWKMKWLPLSPGTKDNRKEFRDVCKTEFLNSLVPFNYSQWISLAVLATLWSVIYCLAIGDFFIYGRRVRKTPIVIIITFNSADLPIYSRRTIINTSLDCLRLGDNNPGNVECQYIDSKEFQILSHSGNLQPSSLFLSIGAEKNKNLRHRHLLSISSSLPVIIMEPRYGAQHRSLFRLSYEKSMAAAPKEMKAGEDGEM